MSFSALTIAVALLMPGAKPDEYSEKWLCDLWAGAQCHATSCRNDGKERCVLVSRRCRNATAASVPKDRADRTAECAKAILKADCGAPAPTECSGVEPP
ncbi:MAG: hypothetical protein ACOZIN_19315 [Myxococcota bacterium]